MVPTPACVASYYHCGCFDVVEADASTLAVRLGLAQVTCTTWHLQQQAVQQQQQQQQQQQIERLSRCICRKTRAMHLSIFD
jgi:hypothetical protein